MSRKFGKHNNIKLFLRLKLRCYTVTDTSLG